MLNKSNLAVWYLDVLPITILAGTFWPTVLAGQNILEFNHFSLVFVLGNGQYWPLAKTVKVLARSEENLAKTVYIVQFSSVRNLTHLAKNFSVLAKVPQTPDV